MKVQPQPAGRELSAKSAGVDDELMRLSVPPQLMQPTVVVRDSWLAGERADCAQQGTSTELLDRAARKLAPVAVCEV